MILENIFNSYHKIIKVYWTVDKFYITCYKYNNVKLETYHIVTQQFRGGTNQLNVNRLSKKDRSYTLKRISIT